VKLNEYEPNWKCQSCGNEISKSQFEDQIGEELEEISKVVLVDCPTCENEVATYEKHTIEPKEQSNGQSKSQKDATEANESSDSSTPFSVN